jgi:peptidoglycan/LPS O-acetylase OafA/YrhL
MLGIRRFRVTIHRRIATETVAHSRRLTSHNAQLERHPALHEERSHMNRHLGALDFYRFVAASGVAILHFGEYANYDHATGFGYIVENFALFVDFFFILSGFVIGLTYSIAIETWTDIVTFLRRRIARIYPLHVVTMMFFLGPHLMGLSAHPENYTLASTVQQLLLIQAWQINAPLPYNFPAWSISAEWAMYLLFPALMFFFRKSGAWILLAVIVVGILTIGILSESELMRHPFFNALRAVPTFAIGVLISQNRFSVHHGSWLGLGSFLAAIILMALHVSIFAIITLFSLTVLFTASNRHSPIFEGKLFLMLGNCSYSIYMLHAIIFTIFIKMVWPRLHGGEIPLSCAVALAPIILAASWVTFRFFEKPMRGIISGAASARLIESRRSS